MSAAACASTPTSAVHPVAEAGFGGLGLTAYEAARPGYPDAALTHCVQQLGLHTSPPASKVLDLAAGTGKLTRQLVSLGLEVVAAEPSPGMRESFAQLLPGVRCDDASAADLPYEAGSFDAVFIGQAFHWFATQEAATEIARVLRPGGGVAMLWNLEDASQPWMAELLDIYRPYAQGLPNYGWGTHRAALTSDWFSALFDTGAAGGAAACSRFFTSLRPYTARTVWQKVESNSFIATLPRDLREGALRRAVDAWLARHVYRFKSPPSGGEPAALLQYRTEAFVCRKRGG